MNKKTLIIIGIIAALALVIVLQRNLHFSSVPSVEQWDGDADEIVLKKRTDPEIRIVKKDGKWFVGDKNYAADESAVNALEKKMNELSLTDLVTKKEFYERFDLTDDRAVHVTVKGKGSVLREILIGKRSSAGEQAYVKFPGKSEVYLAGGNLASEFDKSLDQLRDRNLVNYTIDQIDSITVSYRGQKFTLVKKLNDAAPADKDKKDQKTPAPAPDITWSAEGSSAQINQNYAREFAGEFAAVTADSFLSDDDAKKAGSPQCEIVIKSGGKETKLTVYGKDSKNANGGFICLSGDNPYYAVVGKWKAEKFLKTLSDFTVKK